MIVENVGLDDWRLAPGAKPWCIIEAEGVDGPVDLTPEEIERVMLMSPG